MINEFFEDKSKGKLFSRVYEEFETKSLAYSDDEFKIALSRLYTELDLLTNSEMLYSYYIVMLLMDYATLRDLYISVQGLPFNYVSFLLGINSEDPMYDLCSVPHYEIISHISVTISNKALDQEMLDILMNTFYAEIVQNEGNTISIKSEVCDIELYLVA